MEGIWHCDHNGNSCTTGGNYANANMPASMREFIGQAYNSCGILHSGEVQCWGRGDSDASLYTPMDLGDVRDLTMGYWGHICLISNVDSTLVCIDNANSNWLSGNMPADISNVPVNAVMLGMNHVCAIKQDDSSLHCWGDDSQYPFEGNDIPADLGAAPALCDDGLALDACGICNTK